MCESAPNFDSRRFVLNDCIRSGIAGFWRILSASNRDPSCFPKKSLSLKGLRQASPGVHDWTR